ncbi:MAG: outer membrane beta-barrel protein [Methylococcales bacterium]|nr:outer membrane beta-barrel protein [Methylococcales bacterium]
MKNKTFLALLGLMQTATVYADKGMSPGMLPLGPFDFIPLLNISESHSDNIFYNNLNRKGSLITQIQGGGELALRRKLDRYALHYNFHSSQYHSSPADNYVDHNLGGTAHFDFTQRNRLDFGSSLIYSHIMRGTILFQGEDNIDTQPGVTQLNVIQPSITQLKGPIQYHQYNANINYRYGRTDAKGNLGLQLDWNQLTYDNHPERNSQSDRTQLQITPGFYWRLRPKTYLTTQIQNTFVNYLNNGNSQLQDNLSSSSQDYNLRRYLLGATWDQSAQTKGSLRAGYFQQEFNRSAQPSNGGLTWDAHVQWLPLPYSTLGLNVSNDIRPGIGNGSSAQVKIYNAIWQHNWPNRVTTELNGSYQEVQYQNAGQGVSNGIIFKFDVKYQMRSWLDVGANYLRSDYQSDTNFSDSTQNIFMLYIKALPDEGSY